MTQQPWHTGALAALDFESTDKDPTTARILTCALIRINGSQRHARTWLLDPGVPIHPDAVKVHGITNDHAKEHGIPAVKGVREIVEAVADAVREGVPLVGHNLGGYDLTLLDRECRRHSGGHSLQEICGQAPLVIDTLVLDKHVAPYRKRVSKDQGAYQLRTSAETYGLAWDDDAAHAADYDALQAARVAWKIGAIAHRPHEQRPDWVKELRTQRFDQVAGVSLPELHDRQVVWAKEQAAALQEYLRSEKAGERRDPDAVVDGSWPIRPWKGGDTA